MLARCPPNDLDTFLETIGTPVFVAGSPTGGSTPVLSANRRLLAALGGLPLPDLAAGLEPDLELCRSGTVPVETDHVVLLAKGAERWHLVLAPVVLDGAVVRILVTVADRRPACSPNDVHPETCISAIVEDQAGLICRYDRDTRLTFVNGAYARRFGIEPAKVLGRRIADLMPPDEFTPVKEALASLTQEHPLGITERFAHLPDGNRIWVRWSDRAFFGPDGAVVEYQSVGIEITDHKELERQLQESRDRFRLAVEGTRDGLWDWNLRTDDLWLSPRLKEMLGYSDEELPNDLAALRQILMPEDQETAQEQLHRHWQDGRPYEQTVRYRHRDGSIRHILARGATVYDEEHRPLRMVGAHTDVTALVETGNLLRVAKDQAELASRAKSEFLAMMSHELRTPLNAIIGFAEILRDELFGPLGNDRYQGYVQDIFGSGRHLLTLISDILDLSRADAGQLTLRETSLDLTAVARSQLALVEALATSGGVKLECAAPRPGPVICGDETRIRQIVLNLLSNSVKFTQSCGVVRLDIREEPDGSIALSVTDTGIGMNPEDVPRALEPFSQLDGALNRRHEGTGLGLAIVKRLVELHDGELMVETAPNEGTVITVIFPPNRNIGHSSVQPRRKPAAEPVPLVAYGGAYGRFELLDTLLQAVPMAVAVVSDDGICIRANHTLCRLSGYDMVELLGRPIGALLEEESRTDAQPIRQSQRTRPEKTRPDGRKRRRESQLITRFGRSRTVDVIREPFNGLDGHTYALLLITDISERRRAARALRESEERFRLAAAAARCGIWDADLSNGDHWLSASYFHILGHDEDALAASDAAWRERIHPDDQPAADSAMADHLAGRTPLFEATYRMRHKSGRWIWIAARGAASFGQNGKPRRFVGTLTDISDEIEARQALAEREAQLRTILAVAPAAIVTLDESARIEQFNPCAERMFGWRAEEVRGLDAGLLLTDEVVSGAAALSLLQPDPVNPSRMTEIAGRRRDGSAFPLRIAMASFGTAAGPRYVGIATDISSTRAVEAQLRAALRQLDRQFGEFVKVSNRLDLIRSEADLALLTAEQSNKAKSEFLARMSHELRTPLNAVIGFAEIMRGEYYGPLGSEKYLEYAGDIDQCGRHLLSLINDILDISRIEAGRHVMEEEQVDLTVTVDASVRLLRERAAGKGVVIAVRANPVPVVMGDPRTLKQVVVNLLTNAVKFTPPGGVVEIGTMTDASGGVCVVVKDTGIGIPEGEIPRVLEAFGRASNVHQTGEEGTGLGLVIVGSFLRLHGATLDIDSAVGIGTTVTVRLPIERVLGTQRQLQPWDIVDDR
jgi:PAS domain S-box-containing protein